MPQMESPSVSTLTVKNVPDDVLDALDEQADDSRSQLVREILGHYVQDVQNNDTKEHRPTSDQNRAVYDALWQASNDDLIISERRHLSRVAQESQVQKSILPGVIRELEKNGYVATTPQWPGSNSPRSWRVKPPCADPEQWTYRRDR